MIAIAYLSTATSIPATETLQAILEASRRNNAARAVTGMLCHHDGSFLQFLEGEPRSVDEVFARLAPDPRHRELTTLYRTEIQDRLFPDWTMALANAAVLGAENQAFCRGLRGLSAAATDNERRLVEPFLSAFRAWLR